MSKFAVISVSKFMVAIIQEVGSGQYCGIRERSRERSRWSVRRTCTRARLTGFCFRIHYDMCFTLIHIFTSSNIGNVSKRC